MSSFARAAVPAIVMVHGGPGGQSGRNYVADVQYRVNNGYAVYAINNRGSGGYGKTFYHMDDKKHGDADLRDVVAARDWLSRAWTGSANRWLAWAARYANNVIRRKTGRRMTS